MWKVNSKKSGRVTRFTSVLTKPDLQPVPQYHPIELIPLYSSGGPIITIELEEKVDEKSLKATVYRKAG